MSGSHSTRVQIEYYGVAGSGRNVTEAKRDAGRKIEAALSGSYTPVVVSWRGWAALVYREPGGWCRALIATPDGVRAGAVWASPNESAREEAVAMAQAHVADLGWQPSDGFEPPPFLTDPRLVGEFRSKVEFQLRYRAARERGFGDADAHSYAGRDPGRPELWVGEVRKEVACG